MSDRYWLTGMCASGYHSGCEFSESCLCECHTSLMNNALVVAVVPPVLALVAILLVLS